MTMYISISNFINLSCGHGNTVVDNRSHSQRWLRSWGKAEMYPYLVRNLKSELLDSWGRMYNLVALLPMMNNDHKRTERYNHILYCCP